MRIHFIRHRAYKLTEPLLHMHGAIGHSTALDDLCLSIGDYIAQNPKDTRYEDKAFQDGKNLFTGLTHKRYQ